MRFLDDTKTGLVWCELNIDKRGELFNEDTNQKAFFRSELNSWKKHPEFRAIQDYILFGPLSLGDYLQSYNHDNRSVFYALENNELVGCAVLTSKTCLHDRTMIENYVKFCKKFQIAGVENSLSLNQSQAILKKSKSKDNSCVEYIVVNPSLYKKGNMGGGYGTRMMISINNHPSFFYKQTPENLKTTRTAIHITNTRSEKLFRKSGFEEIPKVCDELHSGFNNFIRPADHLIVPTPDPKDLMPKEEFQNIIFSHDFTL